MFIAIGTICALALYLIYKPTPDATADQYFYKHYFVLTHAFLLPVYALSTWLLFISSKLLFRGDTGIDIIYVRVHVTYHYSYYLLHFFFNNLTVTLAEVICLAGYNIWTYINFLTINRCGW